MAYIDNPAGTSTQTVSDKQNNWLPIFFIRMKKEESKDWCALLNIEVREQHNLKESWVKKTQRTGHDKNEPDIFL